jgi:hypothetical protein
MYIFSIRTAVFVVLLRHGGYFGKKETPFAAAMSPAEAFIGRIAFHLQVKTIFNFTVVCGIILRSKAVKDIAELSGAKVAVYCKKLSNLNFLSRIALEANNFSAYLS